MLGNQVAPDVHCAVKQQACPEQVSPTWRKISILAASTLASASLHAATFGLNFGSSCC